MSGFTRSAFAALALTFVGATAASAQGTATQTLTFEVQKINVMSVTGTPSLVITTAVAGSQPTSVSDALGTYALTSNDVNAKVTIELNSDMPTGVTLKANLTAPAGGTSAGAVTLSSTPVEAVTGITKVLGSALTVTYSLEATVAAGVVASDTKTVTYTLVAGI